CALPQLEHPSRHFAPMNMGFPRTAPNDTLFRRTTTGGGRMKIRHFPFLLALGALAGCETTSIINTDADMYSVKEATAPLKRGARIGLVNGYSQEAKTEIGSQ